MPGKQPTKPVAAPKRARAGSAAAAKPTKSPACSPALRKHAAQVARQLAKDYPAAECELNFEEPFQLLVSTILSAQCTDVRVNMVTPALFAKYPDPAAFAAAPLPAIEKAIKSTGFFRNKAKSIKGAATAIVKEHGGEVPRTLEELVTLPGVGRKTANVVLGTAFGLPSGVVVDTHVGRLSRRLGLTEQADAVKVEQDLMALLPPKEWIDFSHRLIHHGRQVCIARKPRCSVCHLAKICPKIGVTTAA